MERKDSRDPDGSIFKKIIERKLGNGRTRKETVYVARVRQNQYGPDGRLIKHWERKKQVNSYNEAVIVRRHLRDEINAAIEAEEKAKKPDKYLFYDLIDFYQSKYVKPAKFVNGKKIEGQKSNIKETITLLNNFKEYFGNINLHDLTYDQIFAYKEKLLTEPYIIQIRRKRDEPGSGKYREDIRYRKPATAHRYLAKLRRILNIGRQHGFLEMNPFNQGDPLIVASIEEVRDRYCSFEEEQAIYAQCTGRRTHLRSVVTLAIDTFLRENELLSLKGSDIDIKERVIRVREENAKSIKMRDIPLTDRAIEIIQILKDGKTEEDWRTNLIFEIASVKSAWYTALKKAGIKGLHFHDLRGTGITRMLDAGVPADIVMKFSGHDQYETFKKYIKRDTLLIQKAADAMNRHFAELSDSSKGLAKGLAKGLNTKATRLRVA